MDNLPPIFLPDRQEFITSSRLIKVEDAINLSEPPVEDFPFVLDVDLIESYG